MSWTRGVLVVVFVLAAATAAAQAPPRDPIPPGKKNAGKIAQLRTEAQALVRAGEFEKAIATLEQIPALDPTDPTANHTIATFYWEKAYKDTQLSADQKRQYIENGIRWEDAALAINPDYTDALVYKNLLLRMLGNATTDPAERQRLYTEADALRARAMELNTQRAAMAGGAVPAGAPPPPPPPPPPGQAEAGAMQPVRVGGNIKAPTKVVDARPVYPPEAQAARVSGVVICEVVIGVDGSVTDVRVLRSIPLLDAAAVEAVQQWKFTPTLLNGTPVPVIMTVTVNFTL